MDRKPVMVNELEKQGINGMVLGLPLGWSSDWDGEDVGYPDVSVVGLYCYKNINVYIDMDTGNVLEMWTDPMDEEDSTYACY